MKWFNLKLAMLILGALLLGSAAFSASELLTFDNDELRERYSKLSFEFRCPKCMNQNVADSNAPISEDIRQKTYELLHQGYSDQEIVDFMIDRYTEFVIYKPQLSFLTIWLWIVPLALLLAGGFILRQLITKPDVGATEALSDADNERLKKLMEDQ
jgi:cytochrome c-type biogenesis protein CcmH